MIKDVIPVGIETLKIILEKTDQLGDLFTPKSGYSEKIGALLKQSAPLNESPEFVSDKQLVLFIQLLFLLALSMHGGIMMPAVRNISARGNRIHIHWDSNSHDRFTFGQCDEAFLTFYKYFQMKVLRTGRGSLLIRPSAVKQVINRLKTYTEQLTKVNQSISALAEGTFYSISDTIQKPLNQHVLFILISSLPSDQINALLLYIADFLPDDATFKTSANSPAPIARLFQSPSVDMAYLIEKVKLYFDLYYSADLPILRHITQTKTAEFLEKLLKNPAVLSEAKKTLSDMQRYQITTRINLYSFYLNYLKQYKL